MFLISNNPQGKKDAYVRGLALFSSALDHWLPCYSMTSSTNGNHGRVSERPSSRKSANFFWPTSMIEWVFEPGLLLLASILLGPFLSFVSR